MLALHAEVLVGTGQAITEFVGRSGEEAGVCAGISTLTKG
jgi:hypothetical protein